MAGIVRFSGEWIFRDQSRPDNDMYSLSVDWTASAGGSISNTTVDTSITNVIKGMSVTMGEAWFTSGEVLPSDNYDVVFKDEYGIDIFGGEAYNLNSTSASGEQFIPKMGSGYGRRPITTGLTFEINGNSVANACGHVVVILER